MKIALHVVLAVALASFVWAAEPAVFVQARLLGFSADTKVPGDITQLYNQPGVDLLSAPLLTTRSGERGKIEITRNLELPGKGTFPVGTTLSILPTWEGDHIRYTADFDHTQFLGFAEHSSSKSPVLDTCKVIGMDGVAELGKTVLFSFPSQTDKQIVHEAGKPDESRFVEKKFVLVLTFTRA